MGSLFSGETVAAALLVVGLPLYNFFANRWPPFNGALYLPMNLALLGMVLGLAVGPLGLSADSVAGVGHDEVRALMIGSLLAAAVTAPLFLIVPTRWGRRLVADERVGHLTNRGLVYQVLLRIPVGTALVEEVIFRGVLFATWRSSGAMAAAIASSAVFGLWHVGPTINLVRANKPEATKADVLKAIAGAVAFTTTAGLFFVWLRVQIGLVGPLAMHALVNGLATIASVLAYRRIKTVASSGSPRAFRSRNDPVSDTRTGAGRPPPDNH